ncbi:hypothetical protein B0H11DRAFT_2240343 [Mycena galericulata]|nr:hypothetical protein B0H11DRAFT_2240343 [Mycena galericulata]
MTPTLKSKQKYKMANKIIPHVTPTATVVSPTSHGPPSQPCISCGLFPDHFACDDAVHPTDPALSIAVAAHPKSLHPIPKCPHCQAYPDARRKQFHGACLPFHHASVAAHLHGGQEGKDAPRYLRFASRRRSHASRASPAPPEWPLTPTSDYIFRTEAHKKTAVGLHHAFGKNSNPTRAVALVRTSPTPVLPSSPPLPPVFEYRYDGRRLVERARADCARSAREGRKEGAVNVIAKCRAGGGGGTDAGGGGGTNAVLSPHPLGHRTFPAVLHSFLVNPDPKPHMLRRCESASAVVRAAATVAYAAMNSFLKTNAQREMQRDRL